MGPNRLVFDQDGPTICGVDPDLIISNPDKIWKEGKICLPDNVKELASSIIAHLTTFVARPIIISKEDATPTFPATSDKDIKLFILYGLHLAAPSEFRCTAREVDALLQKDFDAMEVYAQEAPDVLNTLITKRIARQVKLLGIGGIYLEAAIIAMINDARTSNVAKKYGLTPAEFAEFLDCQEQTDVVTREQNRAEREPSFLDKTPLERAKAREIYDNKRTAIAKRFTIWGIIHLPESSASIQDRKLISDFTDEKPGKVNVKVRRAYREDVLVIFRKREIEKWRKDKSNYSFPKQVISAREVQSAS